MITTGRASETLAYYTVVPFLQLQLKTVTVSPLTSTNGDLHGLPSITSCFDGQYHVIRINVDRTTPCDDPLLPAKRFPYVWCVFAVHVPLPHCVQR